MLVGILVTIAKQAREEANASPLTVNIGAGTSNMASCPMPILGIGFDEVAAARQAAIVPAPI